MIQRRGRRIYSCDACCRYQGRDAYTWTEANGPYTDVPLKPCAFRRMVLVNVDARWHPVRSQGVCNDSDALFHR